MGHPHIQEAWAGMAAHMELPIHMELGAMAAACMGGRWGPWGRMGATALAWGAAMDPATGAACTAGLMAATTAMALVLEVVTWGRLTEQAPCQVNLVGPLGPRHPCSAAHVIRAGVCASHGAMSCPSNADSWQAALL